MTFAITAEQRRERTISEAWHKYLMTNQDDKAFLTMDTRIQKQLDRATREATKNLVLVRWIRSADKLQIPKIKEHILKIFYGNQTHNSTGQV